MLAKLVFRADTLVSNSHCSISISVALSPVISSSVRAPLGLWSFCCLPSERRVKWGKWDREGCVCWACDQAMAQVLWPLLTLRTLISGLLMHPGSRALVPRDSFCPGPGYCPSGLQALQRRGHCPKGKSNEDLMSSSSGTTRGWGVWVPVKRDLGSPRGVTRGLET